MMPRYGGSPLRPFEPLVSPPSEVGVIDGATPLVRLQGAVECLLRPAPVLVEKFFYVIEVMVFNFSEPKNLLQRLSFLPSIVLSVLLRCFASVRLMRMHLACAPRNFFFCYYKP